MSHTPSSTQEWSLARLMHGIAGIAPDDVRITDLTLDSRAVRAGSLFLAVPGRRSHGLDFAAQAAAQGASAVLWEPADGASAQHAPPLPAGVYGAAVPELSKFLGRIADRFFGEPSAALRVTGITGTNGKTTCAYLLAQCLDLLGSPAAYIGTLGSGRIGSIAPQAHTTPDVISVHRLLARLCRGGVREVAMEVSSHALDQDRVAGVRFHTAAFTNLSRDHLDYHGSMEAYAQAKARLFAQPGLRASVINVGDAFGAGLAAPRRADPRLTVVWVGAARGEWDRVRRWYASAVRHEAHGLTLDLEDGAVTLRLNARLIGDFNAENALVVMACLLSLGVAPAQAAAALGECAAPPGRMEIIDSPRGGKPTAVVDYAHTPDALAKALHALRAHGKGALWCVFGCGGDRDTGKRPLMGAVADELADVIILTDDNPRSENPAAITAAIASGITRKNYRVINDRALAIATALGEAAPVDFVLIAGKGHEDYQIYGETRRPFSDRDEALRHLREAA